MLTKVRACVLLPIFPLHVSPGNFFYSPWLLGPWTGMKLNSYSQESILYHCPWVFWPWLVKNLSRYIQESLVQFYWRVRIIMESVKTPPPQIRLWWGSWLSSVVKNVCVPHHTLITIIIVIVTCVMASRLLYPRPSLSVVMLQTKTRLDKYFVHT